MTLHNELGKLIKASELARFLDLDVRTVKKYAKMLGGIELMPGRYYFHLDKIREIMEVASAKFSTKKREGVLQRMRTNSGNKPKKTSVFPRLKPKVIPRGNPLGGGNEGTNSEPDRHGIFNDR